MRTNEPALVCLTHEQAVAHAWRHLGELPPLPEGFAYRAVGQGRRFKEGWYFDYPVVKVPPNTGGPGSGIGHPPGFIVADDGRVYGLRWMEYARLKREGTSHARDD